MTETTTPPRGRVRAHDATAETGADDSRATSAMADPGRRRFLARLGATAGAAALGVTGGLVLKPAAAFAGRPRELAFHNLHTGERVQAVYWADGAYRPEGLQRVNEILRDWRTGEIAEMDPGLLDLLHRLHATLDGAEPFAVISGYRSPKTNAQLAANSSGVAKKSFHMRGMAIDVALPGRDLVALRDTAWDMQAGGVGYYGTSGFVHLDTGRVRRWNF
jgi:uncharacterized protein YcbK (DUF882 family)